MQQGMLFHHLKEPHSGVDIEQLVVHTPETIDVSRLKAAWQWLMDRHEVLRSQFVWEGADEPYQEIVSEVPVPFHVNQAGHLDKTLREKSLASFLKEDRLQGFDLRIAPPASTHPLPVGRRLLLISVDLPPRAARRALFPDPST